MAANLKGGNAIVRFLLNHGEKLGMAAIVVCAGMLIWSAIGRERLGQERQPEALEQLVTRANTHIQGFRWETADQENKLVSEPVDGEAMQEIARHSFPVFKNGFDPRTLDAVGLRMDPLLAAAEDLEVSGDAGLWASADPKEIERKQLAAMAEAKREEKAQLDRRNRGGAEEGRGRRPGGDMFGGREEAAGRKSTPGRNGTIVQMSRTGAQLQGFEDIHADSWITLLAKVPIQKQHQLYGEALQNARGYDSANDIPNYVGYEVQRAKITAAGEGEWEKIATVHTKSIQLALDTYPVNMADVVAPRFNHPILTHPLPPLILREWDERVSHSSMPLASEEILEPTLEETIEEEKNGEEEDEFAGLAFDNPSVGRSESRRGASRRGALGSRMGRGMREGGRMGFEDEGGMDYGEGGMGGRGMMEGLGMRGGRGMMGGNMLSSRSVGASLPDFHWDPAASHVLLRYFDTTAKPGQKYRYRVRLVLFDVNNNVSSELHLDKTVKDRRSTLKGSGLKYRRTEWSEPSPIASVPLPARVYIAGAKPVKESNYNAEPKAELLVKALNAEYAAEVALLESFSRGSVINLHDSAKVVWATNDYAPEKDPEFHFRTGITLLDFSGGEKLSRRIADLTVPVRAVLMDPAGRLSVQKEPDDFETVSEFNQIIEGGQSNQRGRAGAEFGRAGEGFGEDF